jgi:hypothetical protein
MVAVTIGPVHNLSHSNKKLMVLMSAIFASFSSRWTVQRCHPIHHLTVGTSADFTTAPKVLTITPIYLVAAPIKKIGRPFLFRDPIIGTSSYFGADSATKKTLTDTYNTA